jgi:hypothetical protein
VDPVTDGYVVDGNKDYPSPDDTIGLAKSAIESIGVGAGASWIPGITGHTDDGADHYYSSFSAWCEIMDIDGSYRRYNGDCELDLRDNSPQIRHIMMKAQKNGRDPTNQIAEARRFIRRTCASKAMLIALRRPGLKLSYPRHVLQTKPFAVAKLFFHGNTDDPVLKPIFAKAIADRFLGARAELFRGPRIQRFAAPPIGSVPVDDDDFPL